MTGQWRAVIGWEGLYEASSEGRVRSLPRSGVDSLGRRFSVNARTLRPGPHYSGYLSVTLSREGKSWTRLVHHLVAEAFVGPRPDGLQVCHWDDDPLNNSADNLRYGTPRENQLDALRTGRNRGALRTHCRKAGHPLSGANLLSRKDGKRACRACDLARQRRHYTNKKAEVVR